MQLVLALLWGGLALVLHHDLSARLAVRVLDGRTLEFAGRLFVWLEQKSHRATECACSGEILRGAEKHHRVAVVPTAMVRAIVAALV